MHITWLGGTAVKLQFKPLDEEITVLIDPYKPAKGDFSRSLGAHIALFSAEKTDSITITGEPFTVDTLGELDIKNILISGFPGPDGVVIFKITAENISVMHLGGIKDKLSDELVEALGKVDVLLLPVGGGKKYLSAATAVDLITALEPRVVVPIAHKSDNDPEADPISLFIKESGLKADAPEKKYILKAKDLPIEETKLVILEK